MPFSLLMVASAVAPTTKLGASGKYRIGQSVRHEKFGEGVVLQTEGEGEQERVQINFRNAGIKWLMLAYAKLEVLQG